MMADRKSTRLNYSHTDIYTLSLHDALPISSKREFLIRAIPVSSTSSAIIACRTAASGTRAIDDGRSEEYTSELQSHRYLHSFPTRRSSNLFETRVLDQSDSGILDELGHHRLPQCGVRDARNR